MSERKSMVFSGRHIGPSLSEQQAMLSAVGFNELEKFVAETIPAHLLPATFTPDPFLEKPLSEFEALQKAKTLSQMNTVLKSARGQGYYRTFCPPVIQRNVLENPGWYTQYTPYQAEISQGRLELLFYFQTMVANLTGLPVANASLLDEASSGAEALSIISAKNPGKPVLICNSLHPQTINVVKTRAWALGINLVQGDYFSDTRLQEEMSIGAAGAIVQWPATTGIVWDCTAFSEKLKQAGALIAVSSDPLALCALEPVKNADIVFGTLQRSGVPIGFGGPHAAFFAVSNPLMRMMPGRIIGMSKDARGEQGYRLALQTREQHIRREKATSNICTAQALLANMATLYAIYHGPEGLEQIACRVNGLARLFAASLKGKGFQIESDNFFDTVTVSLREKSAEYVEKFRNKGWLVRAVDQDRVAFSFDELSTEEEVCELLSVFEIEREKLQKMTSSRKQPLLPQEIFNKIRSETEMMRFIKGLENKDLSLTHSMIPLGSCTMKLNAASEMYPLSMPGFSELHPYAPKEDYKGYQVIFDELSSALKVLTGFDGVSLQPNSGAMGEYAGLLTVKKYFETLGDLRDIALIPASAHGTNPASAVLAGFKVVTVECDELCAISLKSLNEKLEQNSKKVAVCMVTYPSTHGVFDENIREICDVVHAHGAQVYLDGANLNAMVGLVKPSEFGADLYHINLHKTFCIPHGGGGPGMGPIAVKKHLVPFLPADPSRIELEDKSSGSVASSSFSSASILTISWSYIRMMGLDGLKQATSIALLNANYIAARLKDAYPVLYSNKAGRVAHECIFDVRPFEKVGVKVEDIAKRLMDYSFHAPTMSWPVVGTLMVEPTESESMAELDRFCEAMLKIREEISRVESGEWPQDNNPLKNAPHHVSLVTSTNWPHPYTREEAAFPLEWIKQRKFWPSVSRIDNVYGDKNFVCACS